MQDSILIIPRRSGKDTFVPVKCRDELLYSVRDGKLQDCTIWIPALGTEVKSLNLAYTRLSECVELGRRGFGGNVFLNAYVHESIPTIVLSDEYPLHLTQLDVIRKCVEGGPRHYRNAKEPPFARVQRYVRESETGVEGVKGTPSRRPAIRAQGRPAHHRGGQAAQPAEHAA